MDKNFTHLHLHTSYSVLDGMCKLEELIPKAKSLGMKALAITDHNHLGGTYQFQKICLENDIKPILGYEAYYTEDTSILSLPIEERNKMAADSALKNGAISEAEYEAYFKTGSTKNIKKSDVKKKIEPYAYSTKQYHIIFIAKNQIGWQNLIKLQSESAEKCTFNGRFLCDNDLIRKYSEGIICTTACIANRIARYVNEDKHEEAETLLKTWYEIFGADFYLEIQPLPMKEQVRVNSFYIQMSEKYSIPLIATNDVHYIEKTDHDDHDTLLCIGTGKFKSDWNRMKYSNDFWLRSYDEIIEAFEYQEYKFKEDLPQHYMDKVKEALENTNHVADMVEKNIQIGSKTPLIPQVKLPEGETAEHRLAKRCWKALYNLALKDEYVKDNLKIYEKRLHEELEVINPKGFASYLLVVDEFITWANKNNCLTGVGRGSAAGSLCLYLLGITKVVDPIKNGLLFSRFLTKDRTAMPDVDSDLMWSQRDNVIHHLEDYYGASHVAHIGTYTIMGVKSGLKDIGRVLEISFDTMNDISKQLDDILDIPQPKFKDFDNLKEECPNAWKKFHRLEEENRNLFRLARKFEGLHRNFGVHASGILAMPCNVIDKFPIRMADGIRTCLFTGPEIDELSALKLDLLGLKTLDIIDQTLKHVDKDMNMDDLIKKMDFKDPNIYQMLLNKKTEAVFQLESDMFKGIISDVKPDGLADITAITSLGRPGPLSSGLPQQYARRKRGEEEPTPILRGMDDILKEAYGTPIYQEMVMAIGVKAFGFNSNQSDSILRKIIGKKRKDKLEMLRRICKYGKISAEGPEGWHDNPDLAWYDPEEKMGPAIPGGLANNYTEQEMDDFWNVLIGFADYCFNKSHKSVA